MKNLAEVQALLADCEQIHAEAEAAANAAADEVAADLAQERPTGGWTRESREQLLAAASTSAGADTGKVSSLDLWHDLAAGGAGAEASARETLIAEAASMALALLLQLADVRPTNELLDVVARRRADLNPGKLSWIWFPGRGLWYWILRRWRSRQFVRAALAMRDHVVEVEEVLALLRTLAPEHRPAELNRLLAGADRYIAANQSLLEGIPHGN